MGSTYTAPASKVLTVLHIRDPEGPVTAGPDPSEGTTVCGLPLLAADLWVPVEARATDAICRGCQGLSDDQGAMW